MLLTPKEKETAILVAQGYKDHEIATKLGVSRRRVCEIVSSIKKKWEIQSRVNIGILVFKLGWIQIPEKTKRILLKDYKCQS